MTPSVLSVSVVNPDEVIWEGEAQSVSSENSAGPFDILPQHANFVTVIRNKPIVVQSTTGEAKTLSYKNAVLVVKDSSIKIYSDIYKD